MSACADNSPRRPARRSLGGWTLLELLLALGATGLIGAGAASILFAVSHGTSSRTDLRALVVRHKTVDARLSTAIRSSHKVLAIGSNYIVLWTGDSNGDGAPNLSELRRIEYNATGSNLWSYEAPAGVTPDTPYTLGSDFNAITTALKGQTSFPGELWGSGVTAVSWSTNTAQTLVSYRLTLQASTMTDVAIGAASLRNP